MGIAILDIFNYANVKHIVDCESGEIVSEAEIFDYKLINYPFAFCDPGYEE